MYNILPIRKILTVVDFIKIVHIFELVIGLILYIYILVLKKRSVVTPKDNLAGFDKSVSVKQ